MSNSRDKSSQEPPAPGPTESATDRKPSGRAAYDERGNPVWEWQLETGVYSRDISTQRLKKLDLNDLSIAETASLPQPPGLKDPPGRKALPGGGFNPYDNSTTGTGNVARDPYNSGARGALKSAPPARKPVDLKKLEEWLELRKRVEQNKREEGED
jgi:hypothetical protein